MRRDTPITPVKHQDLYRPINYTEVEVHGCVYEVTYHPASPQHPEPRIIQYQVIDHTALVQDLTEELHKQESE